MRTPVTGEVILLLILTLLLASRTASASPVLHPPPPPSAESTAAAPEASSGYWLELGQREIAAAEEIIVERQRLHVAKNAILFIGDGMGISTLTAARILRGQQQEWQSGEEGYLSFERFHHTGLAKTYSVDHQTPDSAATATAFLTGVKTRDGFLGVSAEAAAAAGDNGNCSRPAVPESAAVRLSSFLRLAARAGRTAGLVSTARLTHATPAAAYAHSVKRRWEDDADRDADLRRRKKTRTKSSKKVRLERHRAAMCPDIAQQFVSNGAGLDFRVALAGGRSKFLPREMPATKDPTTGRWYRGSRRDGRNLVEEWKQAQIRAGRRPVYIESTQQLRSLSATGASTDVDSVLGLLAPSHLDFHQDNLAVANASERQPSLAELTVKAIELLSAYGGSAGFALLVEAGRIDHGHHQNQANRALSETVALSDAVDAAVRLLGEMGLLNDTLIVVSADHSHVFTMGHGGLRGQPITQLKYKGKGRNGDRAAGEDGLPLTVVNYADGPGAYKSRRDRWGGLLADGDQDVNYATGESDYKFPAMMPQGYESHGGEDVPIYARGPGAHLIHRVHEQSYLAHVLMRALEVGPYSNNNSSSEPAI